jgi:hypothetical protein
VSAPTVAAQQRRVAATTVHRTPDGVTLARIPAPADLLTGTTTGDWTQVTLDGWVFGASLRAEKRDGFDVVVTPPGGENLRSAPNGPVLARLKYGALFERVEARGTWVHVKRAGWVARSSIDAPAAAVRKPAASGTTAYQAMAAQKQDTTARQRTPTAAAASVDRVEVAHAAPLFLTPDGAQGGTLQPGTSARVLGRSGDWVRVQTEGWVHDADLQPPANAALVGVSAAEVRANPDRYVGQTLDWRLQIVSIQTADELRPELPSGQPYLLTRGPMPEPGFVYVSIPADQADRFRALGPLSELTLRVRIRAARTRYLATPVAELVAVVDSSVAHP